MVALGVSWGGCRWCWGLPSWIATPISASGVHDALEPPGPKEVPPVDPDGRNERIGVGDGDPGAWEVRGGARDDAGPPSRCT